VTLWHCTLQDSGAAAAGALEVKPEVQKVLQALQLMGPNANLVSPAHALSAWSAAQAWPPAAQLFIADKNTMRMFSRQRT